MAPILAKFHDSAEWREITAQAYPPPEKKVKPKKVKDRGTEFPGKARPDQTEAQKDKTPAGQESLPIRPARAEDETVLA